MSIRTYAELVPPSEPEREVVLHMTMEEAEVLRALLYTAVQGRGWIREALDNVQSALQEAGVSYPDRKFSGCATITSEEEAP